MADVGNPYKATPIFVGKYELQLASNVSMVNPFVMLTKTNQVCFMSDLVITNYTAGQVLFTLPEECRPKRTARLSLYLGTDPALLSMYAGGTAGFTNAITPAFTGNKTLWLNGASFSINDMFY